MRLLCLSITCGLQMGFSLPSIKCLGCLPSSDYCQTHGNQIVEHSSDNETVLGSSWKLGGAAEHLIDSNKKHLSVEHFILESACYWIYVKHQHMRWGQTTTLYMLTKTRWWWYSNSKWSTGSMDTWLLSYSDFQFFYPSPQSLKYLSSHVEEQRLTNIH